MTVPPGAGVFRVLVAAQWGDVEESEGAHQLLDSARVRGVRVVDRSIVHNEDARSLALRLHRVFVSEVVIGAVVLLLVRERRTEVVSEVAAER